jgi:hypothetical protein
MLDYAVHWTSRGAVAKRVILDAFRGLEPADGGDTEEESDGTESAGDD